MGVSARELIETQAMHFKKDSFPLLSTIAYGTSPDDRPVKSYYHLMGEVRIQKDCEFSFAGIGNALEKFVEKFGKKENVIVKSDGAEIQYWSRTNFYGLPKYFNNLRDRNPSCDFKSVEWYKSTSGHGKGFIHFEVMFISFKVKSIAVMVVSNET